jgi:peptidoglycan/xylan/chitin deacetylase (PgdA/CDA1 family)
MQESGLVEFGAHTHHHRILSRCSPESIDRELSVNVELMEAHLGRRPRYFAYPNGQEGDFNGMTRQVLAKFGFQAAVTTVEGGNHAGSTDLLALQRYGEGSSPAQVEFLASGLQNKLKDRSPRAETAAEAHGKAATI